MEEAIIAAIVVELGSAAFKEIGAALGVTKQLEELKETLESINYTLLAPEADRAQIWFKRLQGVYYDAKEILDDFEFYNLQWQGSAGLKVRQFLFILNNPLRFRWVMGRKIKRIRESLCRIKMDKDACDITSRGGKGVRWVEVTTSVSDTFPSFCKADVIGRDKDAQNILDFLSDDRVSSPVCVTIPIVGMGGIGKTALALKVYSGEGIDRSFDLKLWASVKEDFNNLKKLLRKILASASKCSDHLKMEQLQSQCKCSDHLNTEQLQSQCKSFDHLSTEQLQIQLKEKVKGKTFLLVLDDVRSVDRVKWVEFLSLLSEGARRGKIIVTTRDQLVASVVSPDLPYKLQGLTLEDSRNLFLQWTFGGDARNKESLMKIGEEIVEKCKGVVGAIRTVARLLQGKREEHQWLTLRGDFRSIFDKKGRFISYDELPFHLKPCFAYFSNLPKNFKILGIELIHQWIAQGFIQPSVETQEPEKVGQDYIYELMSRSFLQDTDGYGLFSTIKMHDLVHELAISVAQTECLIVDAHVKDVPENVRHLSFSGNKNLQKDKVPSPLLKMRKVCTVGFQSVGPDRCLLDECISRFKCLRMLGLGNSSFKALPSSIGGLKYLRYLDLSGNSEIESLPHSICRLLLLETLMLQGCVKFVKLPKDVGKLPRLRCLRLTTRERFLSGKLIAGLEKLQCLWIDECGELEHLFDTEEIRNQHVLSTVSVLVIMNCKNLLSLPRWLSSLPKLENLVIVNCEKLDLTKIDECDGGLVNLRYLWVGKLPQLVDLPRWLLGGAATTLNHIRITDCSTLTTLPKDLECLRKLSIEKCPLIASLPDGMSYLAKLEELRISECLELISRCQREKGADWHKISHVRDIYLNGINIQDSINK
ncbi:hypothetical protein LguiA_008464 [Lonicera macranthoides]